MGTHAIPIYLPQIKRQFNRITKHPLCQLRKLQMKCQGMGASIEEILMNIGKGLKMNFFEAQQTRSEGTHYVLSITIEVRIVLWTTWHAAHFDTAKFCVKCLSNIL